MQENEGSVVWFATRFVINKTHGGSWRFSESCKGRQIALHRRLGERLHIKVHLEAEKCLLMALLHMAQHAFSIRSTLVLLKETLERFMENTEILESATYILLLRWKHSSHL